jgi:fucose permease
MITTPQINTNNRQGICLFRTVDGKNLFITFTLVTSLFLLWGFCNGMIDILNKHFQDSLHINKEQSGLVQSMRAGFGVPLVCFVLIATYGAVWQKLEARDSTA